MWPPPLVVYLAASHDQQTANALASMPVLLSYAYGEQPFLDKGFQQAFGRVLLDCGAYSELTQGEKKKVDVEAYKEWAEAWRETADAIAGVDNVAGNWRKSMKNYKKIPFSFPTMHTTDPKELLPELVAMAQERKTWLGISVSAEKGKKNFVRWVCDNVPEGLHLHGWALRGYTHIRRLNSVDSTGWLREAMALRTNPQTAHLNMVECLDVVIKRYQRWARTIKKPAASLF